MSIPEFVIAGIPLSIIIVALVEEIKMWGLTGNILRVVSIVIGVVLAVLYQLATKVPVTLMDWLALVVIGILYGITASGGYDFVNKRIPAKGVL
jgi:hypothetical protein